MFFCLIATSAITNETNVKLLSIAFKSGRKEKSYFFRSSISGKKKAITIRELIAMVSVQINGL
jgi:hypothetical protein